MRHNKHNRLCCLLKQLSCILLFSVGQAKTVRYRSGFLDGDFLERFSMTVSEARDYCMRTPSCISFSFMSPTRFPEGDVKCMFYAFSDWHVKSNGESVFIEDSLWHSYVNTTRERDAVPQEVNLVLERLSSMSNLRGGGSSDYKLSLFDSLYYIVLPKEHKAMASPLIAPAAIKYASSEKEDTSVRLSAMRLLILMGDSSDTGKILFDAGVYHSMQQIISKGGEEWDIIRKTALDVISNICLYRSANEKLRKAGAHQVLRSIAAEPGFPGLQATLALTHLGDEGFEHEDLPHEKLYALVELMRNAIDGDVSYGIKWDLIPGPLSAIKYVVLHSNQRSQMHHHLLDAGIVEQVLRILEADCVSPSEAEVALEIMNSLVQVSERARQMVLFAEHTLHEVENRLKQYTNGAVLAQRLNAFVSSYDSMKSEL
mmetsp:Transcript_7908/g.12100  ORF Transcript_7908/g.12100 Transcript_7908/m.12100 type:complete len:428 (+) Transcript_7908:81-1364(+)